MIILPRTYATVPYYFLFLFLIGLQKELRNDEMDEDDEISEVDAGAVLFNRDDGLPAGYTPFSYWGGSMQR